MSHLLFHFLIFLLSKIAKVPHFFHSSHTRNSWRNTTPFCYVISIRAATHAGKLSTFIWQHGGRAGRPQGSVKRAARDRLPAPEGRRSATVPVNGSGNVPPLLRCCSGRSGHPIGYPVWAAQWILGSHSHQSSGHC